MTETNIRQTGGLTEAESIGAKAARSVLEKAFDRAATKRVTKTDKRKNAYVLTGKQVSVLESAGINPMQGAPFQVTILDDPHVNSVEASYYHAERSDEAGRTPEPRLGREIIRSWLEVGDELLLGSIGGQIFALKLKHGSVLDQDTLLHEVAKQADPIAIMARAKKATRQPERREVVRDEFIRDPFVVRAALIRASGACEMPGCRIPLFVTDDGSAYLEVHHMLPLGEGGDDSLVNVAALCPNCHRELHFGRDRQARRNVLTAYIASIER